MSDQTTRKFDVYSVPERVKNHTVTFVRVVAHTLGPTTFGSPISDNHWTIFFGHDDPIGQIRFDMGFPQTIKGDRGQLVVTDCRYGDPSASAADWWDFGVDPKLHVSDITQYIIDHGRAEYDMQVEAGCRFWV